MLEHRTHINEALAGRMATAWEERFADVVGRVYRVLFDAGDSLQELKEHLFASGQIGPMWYKSWPRASDANAYALDASATRLCGLTNAVVTADHKPSVQRTAVPAVFENIKECIEGMSAQVESVEQEYDGDCSELKTSMQTALTRLETYLSEEQADLASQRQGGVRSVTTQLAALKALYSSDVPVSARFWM